MPTIFISVCFSGGGRTIIHMVQTAITGEFLALIGKKIPLRFWSYLLSECTKNGDSMKFG